MLELHSSHTGCGVVCMHVKGNECLRDCLYSKVWGELASSLFWSAARSRKTPFSTSSPEAGMPASDSCPHRTIGSQRGSVLRLNIAPSGHHVFRCASPR